MESAGTSEASHVLDADVSHGKLTELERHVCSETDFARDQADTKLIVRRKEDDKSIYHAFLVSSVMMIQATIRWKASFAGSFREGRPDHPKIYDFTEDDSIALEILMNIVHLRFSSVPHKLDLRTFASLAKLTDQYMATALVGPWLSSWIGHVLEPGCIAGNESHWLWISWEYGLVEEFRQTLKSLYMDSTFMEQITVEPIRMQLQDATVCGTGEYQRGDFGLQDEHTLENSGPSILDVLAAFPSEVEDTILSHKRAMIDRILQLLYGYLEQLQNHSRSNTSRHFKNPFTGETPSNDSLVPEEADPQDEPTLSLCRNRNNDCILLQSSSLEYALQALGLWPKKDPDTIQLSTSELQMALSCLKLSDCTHNDFSDDGHHSYYDDYHSHKRKKKGVTKGPSPCGSFHAIIEQINQSTRQEIILTDAQQKHLQDRSNCVSHWLGLRSKNM